MQSDYFFRKQKAELNKICLEDNNRIVIGGDFMLFLTPT